MNGLKLQRKRKKRDSLIIDYHLCQKVIYKYKKNNRSQVLNGAVAQLGEHQAGSLRVRGSIPLSSIKIGINAPYKRSIFF